MSGKGLLSLFANFNPSNLSEEEGCQRGVLELGYSQGNRESIGTAIEMVVFESGLEPGIKRGIEIRGVIQNDILVKVRQV